MATLDRLKQAIAQGLRAREEVTPATSFRDDLGADSLDIVELIMATEEEFDIEIPDAEAEKILTVGEAVAYIDGLLSGPRSTEG